MNETVTRDSTHGPQLFGHPRGLLTLFLTEMWERATYYGMRAILILFMTALVAEGGLGLDDRTASSVYGLYISFTYLSSLWGGWVADRLIGQQRAIIYGGALITIGNALLVVSNTGFFFVGLVVIVFGTGLLKPNISAIVAQLYPEGGSRRDAGFSIFYMGINVGAFVGQLMVPIIAAAAGWKIGFVVPALGMLFGLWQFIVGRKHLQGAGAEAPGARTGSWPAWALIGIVAVIVVLGLTGRLEFNPVAIAVTANWAMIALAAGYFAYLLLFAGLDRLEKGRVFVMIALFAACAMFWAGFEQAGASFTLFAERYTDRDLFGWEIPGGAVQGANSLFIIIFAPIVASIWVALGKRNMDPSAPAKFALGLILMGVGFLVMFFAAGYVVSGEKVLPTWLLLTYLFHTFGELCLSPVGLSSMTKLAPPRFVGQVMGVWFLATAIGNNLAGQFAGGIDANNLPAMPGEFLYLFWWGTIAGLVLLMLTPFIKRLMGGVK